MYHDQLPPPSSTASYTMFHILEIMLPDMEYDSGLLLAMTFEDLLKC